MRVQAKVMVRAVMVMLVLFGGERVLSTARRPPGGVAVAVRPDGGPTRWPGRHRRPTTTTVAPPATPTTVTTARPPVTTATTVSPTTVAAPTTVTPTTAQATTTTAKATTTTVAATTTTVRPTTTTAAATTTTAVIPSGRFATLPPGTALPTGAACASRVRSTAEVRPVNAGSNATKGTKANTLYPRVDGQFTGTTDEVLQWAACKWGIDEDIVRAQIALESWWTMTAVGDNGESFGLGQVRVPYHQSAFVDDNAKRSSAYNVDYTYAVFRSCYEGNEGWLNTVERGATYAAGDLWGCVGVWFSGRWHTPAAEGYIARVQDYLNQRIWTTPGFRAG
jgi:hypothetical protein